MAVHPLKNWLAIGCLALSLTAFGGAAHAFTETEVAPSTTADAVTQEKPAAPLQLQKGDDGKAGMALTTPEDANSGGTEVTIPGIGTVGVLPKLDFGLELLYGAGEDDSQASDSALENKTDDDVLIKGTIKHRF